MQATSVSQHPLFSTVIPSFLNLETTMMSYQHSCLLFPITNSSLYFHEIRVPYRSNPQPVRAQPCQLHGHGGRQPPPTPRRRRHRGKRLSPNRERAADESDLQHRNGTVSLHELQPDVDHVPASDMMKAKRTYWHDEYGMRWRMKLTKWNSFSSFCLHDANRER